jgi:IS5 family transposase
MLPRERRDSGPNDLSKARLDQIVDLNHPLAKLARKVDWRFLEERFGAAYTDKPGHPPLLTRLMAGLAILKQMHDLSDEDLCERWIENPYYQLSCGEEFFQHVLVFDRSSMTRRRQRMGEKKPVALIQESLNVAARRGAGEREKAGGQAARLIAPASSYHRSRPLSLEAGAALHVATSASAAACSCAH